ncbi:MAG: creatininase family protein [Planctomycetota bacterium]
MRACEQPRGKKERRVQYMLPHQLREEMKKLSLVFLPLGPLEWHGPQLALGCDPVIATEIALAAADKVGGVVLPTLFMGTERERPPFMLDSLGFRRGDYVIGMDFPNAKGKYGSYYCREEVFAIALRSHLELCVAHGYRYIYIMNGHGGVNHLAVINRLVTEYNHEVKGVKVASSTDAPRPPIDAGTAHAGIHETSMLLHFDKSLADLAQLPSLKKAPRLKYSNFSIVDDGGFTGKPGKGHALPPHEDPRVRATAKYGARLEEQSIKSIAQHVRTVFGLGKR